MRGIITFLVVICVYFTSVGDAQSQSASGKISIFSNQTDMLRNTPVNNFSINSIFNECSDESSYHIYFKFSSAIGKIKKGIYKVKILKHIGSRMKEFNYSLRVKEDTKEFYDIIVLPKGTFSIRVYADNSLLAASEYFTISKLVSNEIADN
jgi:hypothetical protein